MPIDCSPENLVGKTLYCLPGCHFGASLLERTHESLLKLPNDEVSPFFLKVETALEKNGAVRGGIGIVSEPEHKFFGAWVAFIIRNGYLKEETEGKLWFDFSKRLGRYNVLISKDLPVVEIDFAIPIYYWAKSTSLALAKFTGFIADDLSNIKQVLWDHFSQRPRNNQE